MGQAVTWQEVLRQSVSGDVIHPTDPGYDEARTVWNSQIDRRPAVVVMCETTHDVQTALGFAREQSLEVSVRGGGHNTSGSAVTVSNLVEELAP
jgi:FAD/FMN-containing dehydrogenase